MNPINNEEVLYSIGNEEITEKKKQYDSLLITDKRLYHIDKTSVNKGKHSIINLEEIKKVEYFLKDTKNNSIIFITIGALVTCVGLILLLF